MTNHTKNCDWHVDQYPWECTCGLIYNQQRYVIEALTSENERLREALEPLANKGRLYLDALDVEKARAALRQFLWENFGFDLYEWEENEIRF